MKWKIMVLLSILGEWALPIFGQASAVPTELKLEEAIRMAVERNPELKAARKNIDIARADLIDASKRLNPVLTIGGENYPLFESRQGSFLNGQELTARIDYEIETFGKRRLRT